MDRDEWLLYGYERGWVSPPMCSTHDGPPLTEAEEWQFDDGDDPCVCVMRVYADDAEREACEANGGPVLWRAKNRG